METDKILIPVSIQIKRSKIFVVSFILPRSHFREPFFIDSLGNRLKSMNSKIKIPLTDNSPVRRFDYEETDPNIVITPVERFINNRIIISPNKKLGFIFHMSRCGSTLATQMLACNNRFFVLSEPTIIDAVLEPSLKITLENRKKLLVTSINALRACSPVCCENVIIKFRSWNTFYLNLILEEFPNIKWLFIHRNGLEVMSSLSKKPSGWLNGRNIYNDYFCTFLNISKNILRIMSSSEYMARMLGVFCRVVKESLSPNKFIVDYVDLRKTYFKILKKLWSIDLTEKEKRKMTDISLFYSKDINKKSKFKADSNEKRTMMTKEHIELATQFIEIERRQLFR